MEHLAVLREAMTKVPRLAFALGVLGIGVAASSLVSLAGDGRVAIISVIAMLAGMILVYIFSRIELSQDKVVQRCGHALVIATTIIFVALLLAAGWATLSCSPSNLTYLLRIQDACRDRVDRGSAPIPKPDQGGFGDLEPTLMFPPSNYRLDAYPRYVDFSWHPLAGAAKYKVELEFQNSNLEWLHLPLSSSDPWGGGQIVETTSFGLNLPGKNTYRWRVIGISQNGNEGKPSQWSILYSAL